MRTPETTLEEIATEVGIGRRTLFRYYASKNDIPWGQFEDTLDGFRAILAGMPADLPLHEAVHRGVLAFNDFEDDAEPSHRDRMRLILETPALQAHAALKHTEWRGVIAEYVAERLGGEVGDLRPQVVAHVSLALALAAYEQWLRQPGSGLSALLGSSMSALVDHLDG